MNKLVFLALLLLTACQSFELNQEAPFSVSAMASGSAKARSTGTQGEARSSMFEEEHVDAQGMITKIERSNRLQKNNGGSGSAKVEAGLSTQTNQGIGDRTAPVTSKKSDFGSSLQVGSSKRMDMSNFGNPMQSGMRAEASRK